jgi:predicted DsbA family dithiol-disulfide isomerase
MEKKKTIYIDMFLDLICEWCFLGKGVLDSMKDRYDIVMRYHFVEIHPDTPQGGMPMTWHAPHPERFFKAVGIIAEHYGLKFTPREIFPNTHDILCVAEYANDLGLAEPFIKAGYDALMGLGLNLSDPAIIEAVAIRAGLDAEAVEKALADPKYAQRLVDNEEYIFQCGNEGRVPAYIINGKYIHTGVEGDEAWAELFESLPEEPLS